MSETLSVVAFEGGSDAWDAYVAGAEESTFCHLAGWRSIMSDGLGHDCRYLVARDAADRWRGVLPLVRVRSPLLGHYLVSMPFLNAGGPLGTPAARALLADAAVTLARHAGVDLLELRTRVVPPAVLRVSARKVTVRLGLPAAPDELWAAFPSKLRSQIRRPLKEGLEARFGLDQREAFYDVFARTMKDLGTPVLPRAFFERAAAAFPHLIVFGAVYLRDQPVAAGCGFAWRDEFEMTWAAALRRHSPLAPNMLLYWAFMQHMIARSVRVFDFGRCSPGGGTHRFKLQWGGVNRPLPWAQWSPRNVTATPSPERPVFRVAAAVWRRLPLGVANLVGPIIARQIP